MFPVTYTAYNDLLAVAASPVVKMVVGDDTSGLPQPDVSGHGTVGGTQFLPPFTVQGPSSSWPDPSIPVSGTVPEYFFAPVAGPSEPYPEAVQDPPGSVALRRDGNEDVTREVFVGPNETGSLPESILPEMSLPMDCSQGGDDPSSIQAMDVPKVPESNSGVLPGSMVDGLARCRTRLDYTRGLKRVFNRVDGTLIDRSMFDVAGPQDGAPPASAVSGSKPYDATQAVPVSTVGSEVCFHF